MSSFTPFTVKRAIVIEGGYLASPWAVTVSRTIGDLDFMTLLKSDRGLAKALGLNLREKAPFKNSSVFHRIIEARDHVVDQLIISAQHDDDPMANQDQDDISTQQEVKNRLAKFNEASPPQVTSIKSDAFVTEDGERVPAHTMNVTTTPKRGVPVSLEVNAENLNWLAKAFKCSDDVWASPAKKQKQDNIDLDALPQLTPRCNYITVPGGRVAIAIYFRTSSGRHQRHQKRVPVPPGHADFEQFVRDTEAAVTRFYSDNHYGVDDWNDSDVVDGDDDNRDGEHASSNANGAEIVETTMP